MTKISKFFLKNYIPVLIILFGILGFAAAFTLSVEKIDILQNPDRVLSCDINKIFNCGTVMRSKYASIFGVPWSFFGIAGYPAIVLLGMFIIVKSKFPKWLSLIITFGSFLAFALSTWFMYLSSWVIGVFCPWCILSAISSTSIFFLVLTQFFSTNSYNLDKKSFDLVSNLLKKNYNVYLTVFWFLLMFSFCYLPTILSKF
jgi:uncharacterized membrane protein